MDICNDGFWYVLVIFSPKLLTCIFLFEGEFSPSALFVQSPNNMYVAFLALATMCKAVVLNDIHFALQIFDCRSVPESPLYENLISNFPVYH